MLVHVLTLGIQCDWDLLSVDGACIHVCEMQSSLIAVVTCHITSAINVL